MIIQGAYEADVKKGSKPLTNPAKEDIAIVEEGIV